MNKISDEQFVIIKNEEEDNKNNIDKVRERVEGKVGVGVGNLDDEEIRELDESL